MRLSDLIVAQGADPDDRRQFWSIAKFAEGVKNAERFVLDDDVMHAAGNVLATRPSSLLSAYPIVRLPYPSIWLEWRGDSRSPYFKQNATERRPNPQRMGCLIEAHDGTDGQAGMVTWAWVHEPKPHRPDLMAEVCPLGAVFDWREEPELIQGSRDAIRRRLAVEGGAKLPDDVAALIEQLATVFFQAPGYDIDRIRQGFHSMDSLRRERFMQNDREVEAIKQICTHSSPWVSRYGWMIMIGLMRREPASFTEYFKGWFNDIMGEGSLVEALLMMINSRNAVEREPADLTKLNKARTKAGKTTFLPYTRTRLRITRVLSNAAKAHGMSREAARQHKVMGHFKVRATGVFWWSPFLRGDPKRGTVERKEYEVVR